MIERLFLVTRRDLPLGVQAAQIAHAVAEFAYHRTSAFGDWKRSSNTVVLLAVANEEELSALIGEAVDRRVPYAEFKEPDLGNALTSVAIAPTGRSIVRSLPLAF